MGEFKKAHVQYQRATKADSPAIGYQRLGQLYASCPSDEFHDPAKAVAMAGKAVDTGGENSKNLTTLATALRANGDEQLAASTMEKVQRIKASEQLKQGARVAELPGSAGSSGVQKR